MFTRLKTYLLAHKFFSAFLILLVLGGGYWTVKKVTTPPAVAHYVLSAVTRETLITSVSGSGQVSALNQVDIKPKASGDVVAVPVVNGQVVKAGTLIAQLDARDAQKAVRDALANLESAKLSLQKLVQPADTLSLTQSQNTLARAQESKQNAEQDLQTAYDDGFNMVSNAFLDLPGIMSGLQDLLYSNTPSLSASGQWNIDYYDGAAAAYDDRADQYRADTANKYQAARTLYETTFANYKLVSRFSDTSTIESIVNQTYEATKSIAEAVKSTNNLIQFYKDTLTLHNLKPSSVADTHLATLGSYTSKTNTHLVNLLNAANTIKSDHDAIVNANRAIDEDTQSLAKLQAGPDALDIQTTQLSVTQRQNALLDAQEKLADYFVRAPFDGTIAKLDVKKGDSASAGSAVATLITKQQIAEISLNEVDAAKIAIGQKVTVTFDAIDGLTISGEVSDIDTVGTVTQGVVTYSVKITFDTQDDRIKPGMSLSTEIITAAKPDILVVPLSAVKSQGGQSYVEVLDQPGSVTAGVQGVTSKFPPRQVPVEIGLSNDTMAEITSGLKEGDQVISRTVAPTAQKVTTAPTIFGATGATGGNRSFGGGATGGARVPATAGR